MFFQPQDAAGPSATLAARSSTLYHIEVRTLNARRMFRESCCEPACSRVAFGSLPMELETFRHLADLAGWSNLPEAFRFNTTRPSYMVLAFMVRHDMRRNDIYRINPELAVHLDSLSVYNRESAKGYLRRHLHHPELADALASRGRPNRLFRLKTLKRL